MRQILIEIPIPVLDKHVPIFGFGMMLFLAFLSATWLVRRLARRDGLDPDRVLDLGLWIFLWGLVGARLLFAVRNPRQFAGPLDFLKIWQGGIVFYGGVIAAVLVFLWYTRRHKLPAWTVLDVLAPPVALGVAIGRIGCYLNGCCWGKQPDSALFWARAFPRGSIPWADHVEKGLINPDAAASLPIHPTQIYFALAGLLLLGLTLAYYPHRRRHGEVMALLMVGYAISRFLIEYLRGDEPVLADGLTISQNISVVLLIGGLVMWAWLRGRPTSVPLHGIHSPLGTSSR